MPLIRLLLLAGLVYSLCVQPLLGEESDRDATIEDLIRTGERAVPDLLALLDDPDQCRAARRGLWQLGPAAASAAPALLERFRQKKEDPFSTWRNRNGWCGFIARSKGDSLIDLLAAMGSRGVPSLRSAINDEDRAVRGAAAYALAEMGPEARGALPSLLEALRRETKKTPPDDELWGFVAAALGTVGPEAKDALPLLLTRMCSFEFPPDTVFFSPAEPFSQGARAVGKIAPYNRQTLATYLDRLKRKSKCGVVWPPCAFEHNLGSEAVVAVSKLYYQRVNGAQAALNNLLYRLPHDDDPGQDTLIKVLTRLLDDPELGPRARELLEKMGQ
jgi:hypothetical protein